VIALGCWVSSVLKRNGIEHLKIDHPSPRNRNFNDPTYEGRMLTVLREYLSR
jgi:uracil-DNA glycosylase